MKDSAFISRFSKLGSLAFVVLMTVGIGSLPFSLARVSSCGVNLLVDCPSLNESDLTAAAKDVLGHTVEDSVRILNRKRIPFTIWEHTLVDGEGQSACISSDLNSPRLGWTEDHQDLDRLILAAWGNRVLATNADMLLQMESAEEFREIRSHLVCD